MQRYGGKSFGGGLNDAESPSLIKDNELQDCLNVTIDDDGSVLERNGCSKVLTTAETYPITDIEQITAGGTRYNIYANKTDIKLLSGTSGVSSLTGLKGIDYSLFHQWNNNLFYANGVDNIKYTRIDQLYSVFTVLGTRRYSANLVDQNMQDLTGITSLVDFVNSANCFFVSRTVNSLRKYDFSSILVKNITVTNPTRMTTDGTYLYVVTGAGYGTVLKYDYDLTLITTFSAVSFVITQISTNGTNIYLASSSTSKLYKYSMTMVAVSNVDLGFAPIGLCVTDTIGFISNQTTETIFSFSLSTLATTTTGLTVYSGGDIACTKEKLFYLETDRILQRYDIATSMIDETKHLDNTAIGVSVNYLPGTDVWHEHITPNIVYPVVSTTAGLPPNTAMTYRATWYENVSETETSGGIESVSITPNLYKVEVGFDFDAVTQMTKARSQYASPDGTSQIDYINRFRLYRKDGTADYKLQGEYPVWWELSVDLDAVTSTSMTCSFVIAETNYVLAYSHNQTTGQKVSFTVAAGGSLPVEIVAGTTYYLALRDLNSLWVYPTYADAIANTNRISFSSTGTGVKTSTFPTVRVSLSSVKGMTFTEQFYIKVDLEIMLVSGIVGTYFICTRAQKNTTAILHVAILEPVYLFSIIDNKATASLTTVCPVNNGYSENAKYMIHAKERFIFANSTQHPSRLWYSSYNPSTLAGDADLVYTDNWYDIGKNDGDDRGITGLIIYLDNVMVFKEHSIYYLSGDLDTAQEIVFARDIGCVSHHSIVEWYGGLFFMSREGLIYLSGQTMINCSKRKIQTTINDINWKYAYLCSASYYPKKAQLWVSYPSGSSTTCNRTMVLHTNLSSFDTEYGNKCFTLWDRPFSSLQLLKDSNEDEVVYSGDTSGNLLLEDTGHIDITSPINSYAITKNIGVLSGATYDTAKKIRRFIIDFLQANGSWNLLMSYSTDDRADTLTTTMTIAVPCVVTATAHGLNTGDTVVFSTTGALPTGVTAGTTYYSIYKTVDTFNIATSLANALAGTKITTTGTQSGVHTVLYCYPIIQTGTSRSYSRINIDTGKSTLYFNIRFSNPNANEPWHVYNYSVDYKTGKVRG